MRQRAGLLLYQKAFATVIEWNFNALVGGAVLATVCSRIVAQSQQWLFFACAIVPANLILLVLAYFASHRQRTVLNQLAHHYADANLHRKVGLLWYLLVGGLIGVKAMGIWVTLIASVKLFQDPTLELQVMLICSVACLVLASCLLRSVVHSGCWKMGPG